MTIRIKSTLRQNGRNNPDDVLVLKQALHRAGYYDIPEYGLTPYPDTKLFEGIKNFQKKNDLKVDGVVNPEGETILQLNKYRHSILSARTPTLRCTECGGPHGGSAGDMCPDCDKKS